MIDFRKGHKKREIDTVKVIKSEPVEVQICSMSSIWAIIHALEDQTTYKHKEYTVKYISFKRFVLTFDIFQL